MTTVRDLLHGIDEYREYMTISQVCVFFERKGVRLTKSMIQNYVRDGLLRPPVGKRYYTRRHLAVLALADGLKGVYDMRDIRAVLKPMMDAEGICPDVYRELIRDSRLLTEKWTTHVASGADTLRLMLNCADIKEMTVPGGDR
jgi:DNA-binding transcriptional MerR regulator